MSATPDRFREDHDADPAEAWADAIEEWRAQASEEELADYYKGRWTR